jgi:drug/metabolite transporter (DMT)-like permease
MKQVQGESTSTMKLALAYLSVFLIWGSTYLAIRIGVRDIPPALFAGLRFLAAGAVMLLYGRLTNRSWPARLTQYRTHLIVGILLLVGGNGMVVWSEQWVHSGLAAVIIASVPLFMSSIDALVPGGHRLSAVGWTGILVGLGGVVMLVSPSFTGGAEAEINPVGILGLLFASLSWSVGSIYSKRQAVGGDVFMNTAVQMFSGGVVLMIIAFITGETGIAGISQDGFLALLYLIVFGSIIGYTAYTYLLHHVPPAKASTYAYVNPIVAILLGALILAEPLEMRTLLSTAVILAGVAIVQFAKTRKA